ncbi:hypothetical protein A2U01_0022200, partial [Trifolium medium]|nr:hypothetical protein [Trifolium medium]
MRQSGNEEDTSFWDDPWLEEGVTLRERFLRLAGLSLDLEVSVRVLCRMGWGVGGGVELEEAAFCVGGGISGRMLLIKMHSHMLIGLKVY